MHWSEKIAQEIVRRRPDKEEYVCAAGISPSGTIHIGNFRDVATSYFVVKALRKMGKKARLLFSWDEYDRLRKIPVDVARSTATWSSISAAPMWTFPTPLTTARNFPATQRTLSISLKSPWSASALRWTTAIRAR